MNKQQLIEHGKHYFDDNNVKVMYATSDGNFFYESCKNYADSHSRSRKIELFKITREDLKTEDTPEIKKDDLKTDKVLERGNDDELAKYRTEAKKLKIKGYHLMGIKRLKEEIELKNN